ncbi:MAG: AAA family ATPase [Clostridia bacterium]|nr:AAA family ATPase [Clostridia bacterium]
MEKQIIDIINSATGRVVIAIDGRCASGKTTLAEEIKERTACAVVHMDDFFVPRNERRDEIGGNICFERLISDVLIPFKKGEAAEYRSFLCKKQTMGDVEKIEEGNVLLLEGTYSTHEKLKEYVDYSFVLDIAREEQVKRIKKRNPDNFEDFINIWIPREEEYFKAKK